LAGNCPSDLEALPVDRIQGQCWFAVEPRSVGAAKIFRVPAGGGIPEVVATGFTHIVDFDVRS
jgi:hypothetical protein